MLIPNGGNVYTASVYMNYVYDPKVQALMEAGDPKRNIIGIYYIPPVIGAKAEALKINPAVANNPLIFPTQKMLDNVHLFDPQGAEQPEVPDGLAEPDLGVDERVWASSTGTEG